MGQALPGHGYLKRNEDGTVSSHAKAEAAAGIVRERFPLRQAFSPRRVVQSSEQDACFRKFSSINCDSPSRGTGARLGCCDGVVGWTTSRRPSRGLILFIGVNYRRSNSLRRCAKS